MSRYLSVRDIDWRLLLIALVICVVGVVQIYSATLDTSSHGDWWKQIFYVVSGLGADVGGAHHRLPYAAALRPDAVPRVGCGSVDNLCLGRSGVRIDALDSLPGGFHLQVSEFVKLVIILLVARFLTDLHKDDLDIWDIAEAGGFGAGSGGAGIEATGYGNGAHLHRCICWWACFSRDCIGSISPSWLWWGRWLFPRVRFF